MICFNYFNYFNYSVFQLTIANLSNQKGQTGNMNMLVILGGVTGDSSIQSEFPISRHLQYFVRQNKPAGWVPPQKQLISCPIQLVNLLLNYS